MRDVVQVEEMLSALIDGELSPEETSAALEKIMSDAALAERWRRYEIIRQALHGVPVAPRNEIGSRVAMALQTEPTILAPQATVRHASGGHGTSRIAAPRRWVAIAASMAAVALLATFGVQLLQSRSHITSVAALFQTPTEAATPHALLADYLDMHNDLSYSAGTQGSLRYARLVSHVPR